MSEELKALVGRTVCEHVQSGMRLGIGTGSTAEAFIRALSAKVNDGLDIIGVPTSERTAQLCRQLEIPLTTLEDTPQLDITIDGADEVDENLALTKGGGGAMLREKIVAAASKSMYVIADEKKLVKNLGAFAVPVEVNKFGLGATRIALENLAKTMKLNANIKLRKSGDCGYITDGGHLILDASFGLISDVSALDTALLAIPGVVQHGLFVNMASKVFVAKKDDGGKNRVDVLERNF